MWINLICAYETVSGRLIMWQNRCFTNIVTFFLTAVTVLCIPLSQQNLNQKPVSVLTNRIEPNL